MLKPLSFFAILILCAAAAMAPLRAQVFEAVSFPYDGDSLVAFAPGPAGDVYALLHPRFGRGQLYLIRRGGGVVAQPHLDGAFETSPDTRDPREGRRCHLAERQAPGVDRRTGARPGNPLTTRSGLETVVAGPSGRVKTSL